MVENPGLMEFKYLNPLPLEQSNYYHQLNEHITYTGIVGTGQRQRGKFVQRTMTLPWFIY